jgi:hypothetical protein
LHEWLRLITTKHIGLAIELQGAAVTRPRVLPWQSSVVAQITRHGRDSNSLCHAKCMSSIQSQGGGPASPHNLREGQFTMNRMPGTLIKLSSFTALTLGAVAVTSTRFAASGPTALAVDDLQAQTAHHAMMAADYLARMRTDEKHAIVWFTQANHCDQKAEQLRVASRQTDGQSSSQRDTAVL